MSSERGCNGCQVLLVREELKLGVWLSTSVFLKIERMYLANRGLMVMILAQIMAV